MAVDLVKKVEDRKAGREQAKTIIELIGGNLSMSVVSVDYREGFWDAFKKAFPDTLAKPKAAKQFKPMTDDESSIFGQKIMPFGKFKGMKIDQIDKGYLEWFANQPDDFKEDLQRYLASNRVKREN